jgi:hypothetical protein
VTAEVKCKVIEKSVSFRFLRTTATHGVASQKKVWNLSKADATHTAMRSNSVSRRVVSKRRRIDSWSSPTCFLAIRMESYVFYLTPPVLQASSTCFEASRVFRTSAGGFYLRTLKRTDTSTRSLDSTQRIREVTNQKSHSPF